MEGDKCGCGGKEHETCAACSKEEIFAYWCDSCKRSVGDKRCPYCGLKCKRKKL